MKLVSRLAAGILFLMMIPVLIVLLVLIRIETKGNPIFVQRRVGQGGKIFNIYKLRTMRMGTQPTEKISAFDLRIREVHRVTRIGKILRRFYFDEIPQLLNIFLGDMCFVGPRPRMYMSITEKYYAPRDSNLMPGLTGLWQISSFRYKKGYSYEKFDKFYLKKKCLIFDLWIILSTVSMIVRLFVKKESI